MNVSVRSLVNIFEQDSPDEDEDEEDEGHEMTLVLGQGKVMKDLPDIVQCTEPSGDMWELAGYSRQIGGASHHPALASQSSATMELQPGPGTESDDYSTLPGSGYENKAQQPNYSTLPGSGFENKALQPNYGTLPGSGYENKAQQPNYGTLPGSGYENKAHQPNYGTLPGSGNENKAHRLHSGDYSTLPGSVHAIPAHRPYTGDYSTLPVPSYDNAAYRPHSGDYSMKSGTDSTVDSEPESSQAEVPVKLIKITRRSNSYSARPPIPKVFTNKGQSSSMMKCDVEKWEKTSLRQKAASFNEVVKDDPDKLHYVRHFNKRHAPEKTGRFKLPRTGVAKSSLPVGSDIFGSQPSEDDVWSNEDGQGVPMASTDTSRYVCTERMEDIHAKIQRWARYAPSEDMDEDDEFGDDIFDNQEFEEPARSITSSGINIVVMETNKEDFLDTNSHGNRGLYKSASLPPMRNQKSKEVSYRQLLSMDPPLLPQDPMFHPVDELLAKYHAWVISLP